MDLTIKQLLDKAIQMHEQGKHGEAELIYKNILKDNPKHGHTNHNLGVLMSSLNQVEKTKAALPLLKIATEADSSNAQFWMSYSNALYATNFLKDAVTNYEKVLKLKPDYAEAHNNLGTILHKLGKLDEAIEHFIKAIQFKPDLFEALNNIGAVYKEQRNFDKSESMLIQAINIKPDYSVAHFNLGNLYKDLGRFKDAILEFYKVLDIDPKYPQAHYNLINALENEAKFYHNQLFDNISMNDKLKFTDFNSKKFIKKSIKIDKNTIEILNKLSEEINKLYGFNSFVLNKNNPPSINVGPYGLYANEFFNQWNSRFLTQVKIGFIMNKYPIGCRHVLIKLPNDKLFDGVVGVHDFTIYNKKNLELVVMEKYDLQILDKHSWGIARSDFVDYPSFSLNETSSIIKKYLDDIYID